MMIIAVASVVKGIENEVSQFSRSKVRFLPNTSFKRLSTVSTNIFLISPLLCVRIITCEFFSHVRQRETADGVWRLFWRLSSVIA